MTQIPQIITDQMQLDKIGFFFGGKVEMIRAAFENNSFPHWHRGWMKAYKQVH